MELVTQLPVPKELSEEAILKLTSSSTLQTLCISPFWAMKPAILQ